MDGSPVKAVPVNLESLAVGSSVTKQYNYDSVTETYSLFSMGGSLTVADSADLATLFGGGGEIQQVAAKWYLSNMGKPTFAVSSPDSRYLFVGESVGDTISVIRLK